MVSVAVEFNKRKRCDVKCPSCGLTNPPEAMKCDCGFNFKSDVKDAICQDKYASEAERQRRKILEGYNVLQGIEKNLAGKWKRFVNCILDGIFMLIIIVGAAQLFVSIGLDYIIQDARVYYLLIVISLTYYVLPECLYGKTLSKFITRTKVVTVSGSKPDFQSIIVRTVCRHIPFEPFSVLVNTVGWHDSISKTRVVNCNYD